MPFQEHKVCLDQCCYWISGKGNVNYNWQCKLRSHNVILHINQLLTNYTEFRTTIILNLQLQYFLNIHISPTYSFQRRKKPYNNKELLKNVMKVIALYQILVTINSISLMLLG